MTQKRPAPPEELILAMLRDVLARQAQQMGLAPEAKPTTPPPSSTPPRPASQPAEAADLPAGTPPSFRQQPEPMRGQVERTETITAATLSADYDEAEEPLSAGEAQELSEFNELATHPVLPSSLPRTLRWLVFGLLTALVLVNVPFLNGLALARALPDRQALIIRDGLLLKGSGPQVYVLEDNHKRWISSLDAFGHYGYRWDEVHVVDDAFLSQFPDGRPIHVLLKCSASPHIYRLENDEKRWIRDIPTFEAEGHVWEDVRFVSCEYLRSIPDGPPIPPDAGPPPQP